ncbi:MAG: hypothetical protein Q7J64_01990 [Elusimicrobiota bacterium]|nr:hypothetical protein [Elusimicrobiota bacterium]
MEKELEGVILRMTPFGTGSVFHVQSGKAFMFRAEGLTKSATKKSFLALRGKTVLFQLKNSKRAGQPRTAVSVKLLRPTSKRAAAPHRAKELVTA